jgi:hypothetical protein
MATQARHQVSSHVINEVIDGEAVMIDIATGKVASQERCKRLAGSPR